MKIGFIGVGNMAQAIIKGLLKNNFNSDDIIVHSAHVSNYGNFSRKYNLQAAASNSDLVKASDVVILAVKPPVVSKVAQEVKNDLTDQQLVISLASGISLDELSRMFTLSQPIVRAMPNVNVEIQQGMTALAGNRDLSQAPYQAAAEIFDQVGATMPLAEDDFPVFSALAGSAPAYAYLFIDALSRAGVKHGLTKEAATTIAAQMAQGSAKMVLESDEIPYALIDKVCSPGGTTVQGLLAMQQAGFEAATVQGIDATIAAEEG